MMKNLGDPSSSSELEKKKKKQAIVIIMSTFVVLKPTYPSRRKITSVDLGRKDPIYNNFVDPMKSFCATTSKGPRIYLFGGRYGEPKLNNMYSYDLLHLKKKQFIRCKRMLYKPVEPLIVPVGNSVYFLDVNEENDGSLFFRKYHPQNDLWDLVPSKIINEGVTYPEMTLCFMPYVSHVVIGHTLHISLLNATGQVSSFAFDTKEQAWGFSKLFDTYWSDDKGLSPSDFYGGQVWNVRHHREFFPGGVKEDKRTFQHGQPFGFYGKGIMWVKENVLLDLHCFSNDCHLFAFQLDGTGTVVVATQPFAFPKLGPLFVQSHLVDIDLDGDGVFGLVQFVHNMAKLELLTCQIQRASQPQVGRAFSIKVVKREPVEGFPKVISRHRTVFSV